MPFWRRNRRRDETGAVAIMVALMAVLLVSVCALTVDLGYAYVQKHAIQKRTDFAALAGGAGDDLPMTAAGVACNYGTAGRETDQAVVDAASYLNDQVGDTTITPEQLVDCDLDNGEAGFGRFVEGGCPGGTCLAANPNQLTVISQPSRVSFGFAGVMGFESVDVAGRATVEIKTPLLKTLPFYAKDGCNYGNQTIAQPTNGNAVNGILLASPADTNAALLNTLATNPASTPAHVPVNVPAPDDSLEVNADTGTLAGITAVGFFLSGSVSSGPAPVVIDNTPGSSPDAAGQPTNFGPPVGGVVTIPHLPAAVTSVEAVWYLRVKIGGQWSPITTGNGNNMVLRALPLTVGTPTLTCGQGSNAGNFGTLNVPPTPTPAGINGQTEPVAYNIIEGLTNGLAPFAPSKLTPDKQCTAATDGAQVWNADGTNCVDTLTGLDSTAAEMGFVTGIGSTYSQGLLEKDAADADTQCPFNYPSGTTHLTNLRGRTINNDVLTCYFTSASTTISQVSSPFYAGSGVIDQSVFLSPRFVQVPVLSFVGQGGSNKYQILDFRPGFITDQPPNATRDTGAPYCPNALSGNATGACNGIAYDHGQLNSINVVFINPAALPNPPLDPDGKYIPYVGSGTKIAMMVD